MSAGPLTLPTGPGLPDAAAAIVTGVARPAVLHSSLAVAECATASVAGCLLAAAELAHARTGRRPVVTVDTAHVAAAVRSEALLRDPSGQGVPGFAPLSRLWPAADGWVRTHANYPWHRAALLRALAVPDGPDDAVLPLVCQAIERRPATDVERLVYEAGGLAVAARTTERWRSEHPSDDAPLVSIVASGAAPALPAAGPLPASGVRVLDLTRVLAGPVATRMLAALGADVLRVDDPARPELESLTVDGVLGKASTMVDARTPAGLETLHRLAAGADVIVTGCRPGALDRFGLAPARLAERHPGTIVATLSAWGTTGVWGARRGFDSLVQIATGIGWAAGDGTRPGALPCQLLDHATGYLLACGVLAALTRRARAGEVAHVSVSLERTARWLLEQGTRAAGDPGGEDPDAYRVDLGDGWTGISPPGSLDGRPLRWPHLPPAYGVAQPAWG
ncbi:CoA transferase [Actinoplanes sp. NPDC049681]|uniref:CoA transferase n=1 Tax=Actinoplanes sp. NPDC049681 TaxID=3363905 RepID=UPI00379F27EA